MTCRNARLPHLSQHLLMLIPLVGIGLPVAARADQVVVNGANHTNVKITGLENGKLQIRMADGRTISPWIDEVQLLLVDRGGVFEDFNQAEQFQHDGDPLKAVARYERTLRLTQEYWPELIACRLAAVHDRAGQIDRTTQYFVRLVNGEFTGITAAARLYPTSFPEKRDARVARAVDLLAEESRKSGQEDRRAILDVLRYDILAKSDPNAAKALARTVVDSAIASSARTKRVYDVIFRAMRDVLAVSPDSLKLTSVDRALRECPDSTLAEFLVLKGQLLMQSAKTPEDFIHAAWTFLRVPIHMPDSELAPRALLEAARAMNALQRPDQAHSLVAECLNHPKITAELRAEAQGPLDVAAPKGTRN